MTTQTFPLTGPINLRVRLGHGSLTVTTADDLTEASVSLTPREATSDAAARIEVAMNGPTLEVKQPRKGGLADLIGKWRHERDAVDAEITIPSGTALDLTTYTADITVRGRSGGADVTTGSAAIALGHVDGDVRLRGGRSNCRIDRVTGSAVARSGAGSVSFGEVGGSVHADFGSGDVEIGTARGSVRSRSGSGNARFDAVYGDVDFATGAGQVSIGLPSGVAAQLDVQTGSGEVVSELPIDDRRTGTGTSIKVRARIGSGDVRLFRAA
jgi:DUF4097 and DUF4098 domain-containing protein YvlB